MLMAKVPLCSYFCLAGPFYKQPESNYRRFTVEELDHVTPVSRLDTSKSAKTIAVL